MISQDILRMEAAHYQTLQEQLRNEYATIDEETLADTLEGISELPQMIEEIVRSSLEDEAMIEALKMRAEAIAARLARFKERHQKKRQLASWALGAAGLAKLKACDFTVSLCEGALRLEVSEESKLADVYFVPQPAKIDRAGIAAALKRGETVEGACFVQGQPYISVSTR